jgi:hypothetical protein
MLAVAAGVGVATGAIPDSGGTINGCYTKTGGIVRVVDTEKNQRCISSAENPTSWSQRGPKGDTGPQGDAGPAGTTGQGAQTVLGTGSLRAGPPMGDTLIPGLKLTVDVPPDSVVYVSTDGGVTLAPAPGASAYVDIKLVFDDFLPDAGNFRRLLVESSARGAIENWSFEHAFALPPGKHTFQVQARVLSSNLQTPDPYIGSDPYDAPAMLGQLTAQVLKR